MASTSIQTVPPPAYDVFLNFRGEDTRYKFTDHLYRALVDRKIITFRDDKELEMGKPISLELLEAIEKSRIAVIIFSENYASSTWCLEELAKIVECRDRGILTVLPIFYHVEPTDVRRQTNTFEGAFTEHEKCFKENPEKVQKWRAALTSVANLTGKPLKDGMHEANFIQSFVEWLNSILKEKRSNDIEDDLVGISSKDDLVGIRSRVEKMILDLDLKATDVRFIGICERSGMGKTTLARAVFDKILNQFEASSFLENVREESKAHGLKTLQERLLCDIGKGGLRVKDEHKGMQVISDILHNKKALIVVDDVSERSQLEKLVGKRDLFGQGSRIIVTTEDKDLLASYEIKIVYKARGLNEVEALRLFSLNAFHKPHCENDFLENCNNFVEYAQGIPLVLKVLGSYLCTRTKNEWESAQNQLRAIPHEKTTKKLRIAFDGLGAEEKKLFLDIACFFKGEEKNRVADILESVYFLDINLKNLIDKSLITLVRGEKLWMHNLLQQMGWEIASEESKEARERSRLWCCDNVLDVVKNNTGTKHIERMLLRLPPDEEVELNAESFSKMNKLRLLKICKVRLSCLSYLSNELCLLEWHDYPLESLPNSFQPVELVELIMPRSCIQQLPSEFSKLGKLKLIDLSDSQNLTRTPDFTGLSNIERLNFQGCTRLHVLHPSVRGLKRLILLNLKDCKCLENLPDKLNLESLKTLILSGCSRFKKFPCIGRNMRSLLKLYLDGTAIEELPPTIGHLTGLTLLNLQDCKNLKSFPSDIHSLTSLEILTLSGCKCQPPISATLTFPRLISFLFLSFLAWRYTDLRIPICATIALSTYCFLNARHSEPEPINLLLSNSFSKFSTLVTLSLSDCNLLALPDDPSCLSSVEYLNLSKNNFICLPDYISELSKLKILFLGHCSKLKSLPYVPLSTRLVSVQGCTSLENYSNEVVVWTLGVAGFTIITCLGLAEDEEGTIAEVSLLDKHLFWQRYVKDQIHQMEGFCHVLPQIEIPKWFGHQRFGSFRPIPLPSNLFGNKNWKGIALCVIFVVPAHSNDVSPGEDTKYFHEFYCLLDKYGDLITFKVPKETYVGSFGLWLYISHARFRKHLDERSCITPFIGTNSPDIEINTCGARILFKQNMGEFLQNLGQEIFGSPNDLREELKSHSQLSRLYQDLEISSASPQVSISVNLDGENDKCICEVKLQHADIANMVKEKNLDLMQKFGGIPRIAEALGTDLEKGILDFKKDPCTRHMDIANSSPSLTQAPAQGCFNSLLKTCNDWSIFLLFVYAMLLFGFGIVMKSPTDWHKGVITILFIMVLVAIRSLQELWLERSRQMSRMQKTLEMHQVEVEVEVIREGSSQKVSISDVLLGDIVCLERGSLVPADGLLVSGEYIKLDDDLDSIINNENPFLFYGPKVIDGKGRMLVRSVGMNTTLGDLLNKVTYDVLNKTPLPVQLDKLKTGIQITGLLLSILNLVVLFFYFMLQKKIFHFNLPDLKGKAVASKKIMDTSKKIFLTPNEKFYTLSTSILTFLFGITEGIPFAITLAIGYWNKKMPFGKATIQEPLACLAMNSVTTVCIDKSGWRSLNPVEVDMDSTRGEIEAWINAGVNIILISDDSVSILEDIAFDYGLLPNADKLKLEAKEFRNYTIEKRMYEVDKIILMGSLIPSDKLLLVQCLKKKGHTVAMVGVSSNVIPALKEADVSITIQSCSSEIVRESCNIIIMDGNLGVLVSLVRCGRCIHDNICKYMKLELTMNIAGLLIIFITTTIYEDSPITTIQLAWANFVVTLLGGLGLLTEPPSKKLMEKPPLRQTKPLINMTMWTNVVIQALYQSGVSVTWQCKGQTMIGINKEVSNTIIFNSFVLCQVCNIINARQVRKMNVVEHFPRNPLFWLAVGVILLLQVAFIEITHILAVSAYARLTLLQWFICLSVGMVSWVINCLLIGLQSACTS